MRWDVRALRGRKVGSLVRTRWASRPPYRGGVNGLQETSAATNDLWTRERGSALLRSSADSAVQTRPWTKDRPFDLRRLRQGRMGWRRNRMVHLRPLPCSEYRTSNGLHEQGFRRPGESGVWRRKRRKYNKCAGRSGV